MNASFTFFATTPKGMEPLLADELRALGAREVRETRAGASFSGPLALGYRVCLWSRIANRVLLPLARFEAPTPEALYQGVQALTWDEHLAPEGTLAVDFNTAQSQITHSHYGALKVKDAIVDQFRERCGTRPSVDVDQPDLRVNVYLHRDHATISLDLSGDSLHRRGYREQGAAAPLKENLAAAILLRAGWPELAQAGGALVDLMCGSGTLPIEAALMAADVAPGLLRTHYGFLHWRGHDATAWAELLAEARQRRERGLQALPLIRGYDSDGAAVRVALANVQRAGLSGRVRIERRALSACVPEPGVAAGLVVVNPPYGERLGERTALPALYALLGEQLRRCFPGWRAAILTSDAELGRLLGLRARRIHTLYNGALECKLLHFQIEPEETAAPGSGAEMFANRLSKDLKHYGRWAQRQGIQCYRLYDADMPEYALAIDIYQGEQRWAHAQEYAAPNSVDPRKAEARLHQALAVIPQVLEIPAERVFLKQRRRQKDRAQYQKLAAHGRFHEVAEGPCRFLVNFTDYLDTGLFLDHRLTRTLIRELARGKRFLNLFGYTGTATVCAAAGGALSTTTVDMSRTYLDWAHRNLALNGLHGGRHEIIQADVLKWLDRETPRRYGLIFLDPPTFSNSKRMAENFDVQRDHVALIMKTVRWLEPDGVLIFSNNHQRFKLDREALAELHVQDITRATLPKDFERNPRIHGCWRITQARTRKT